ncbi:winged helix-turn-helix transcriptional regulator [Actinacidiphila sp. bgisy160]|uniref:winged helix-turn-helix transcriptional regulator n=1 Tax=Actinacidiphila sp. bgisy160 TaxID=3413796 RepID=UPI003D745333
MTSRDITAPDIDAEACTAFQAVLEQVGRRWTGAVLLAAARGARRFTDYRRMVPGISDRLLSQRLKELETLGLVSREVIPSTPVQIHYHPSARGTELLAALEPLTAYGLRHAPEARPAAAEAD